MAPGTLAICQITNDSHYTYDLGLLEALRRTNPGARLVYLTAAPRGWPAALAVEEIVIPTGRPTASLLSPLLDRVELGGRLRRCLALAGSLGARAVFVAYFETWSAALLGRSCLRDVAVPTVFCLHNHVARAIDSVAERRMLGVLGRALVRSGRAVLACPDDTIAAAAREMLPGAAPVVRTLPHPVPTVGPEQGPDRPNGLLYIGRPGARKSFADTVALVGRVRQRCGDALRLCQLRFVGEGMGRWPDLTGDGVEVVDRTLSNEQWMQTIKSAKFVFLPYGPTYEYNTSGVLYDALACGRPVVVSNRRALAATVRAAPGVGYVFSSDNELCAILAHVVSLSEMDWRRMCEAVARRAESLRGALDEAVAEVLS